MEDNEMYGMNGTGMNNMIAGMVLGSMISQNNEAEYRQELAIEKLREIYHSFCPSEEMLDQSLSEFILLKDMEGAERFLDRSIARELIFRGKNQRPYPLTLEQKIESVRQKYLPFYQKIGAEMPESIRELTAARLCEVTGQEELPAISPEEYEDMCRQQDQEANGMGAGTVFLITIGILLGIVLLVIILTR